MSEKLNEIPYLRTYDDIRMQMARDLQYRLCNRHEKTSLGRPLYYRINVQVIVTQECPYSCPFCIERKNPMQGQADFSAQIESLKKVLYEHPNARLTITGGEPGLYPEQVQKIVDAYKMYSNQIFCSINTAGFATEINNMAHINLSYNDYVHENPGKFPNCTVQTILPSQNIEDIKKFMQINANSFSFRFLSSLDKTEYPIDIWNALQNDKEINVHTFRVGDFFVYATFDYVGKHARLTLGDMWQQKQNKYMDGYSNVIIHPDGSIRTNWS